jgi:hypothetical protein
MKKKKLVPHKKYESNISFDKKLSSLILVSFERGKCVILLTNIYLFLVQLNKCINFYRKSIINIQTSKKKSHKINVNI